VTVCIRRAPLRGALLLGAAVLLLGCQPAPSRPGTVTGPDEKSGRDGVPAQDQDGGRLRPLRADARGTLKGRVVLEGDRPDLKEATLKVRQMIDADSDRAHCGKGDTTPQQWKISSDGGVANAVVWLRPPEGSFFPMAGADLDPKTRTWRPEVVIDQPVCGFEPHVVVLFPSFRDPDSPHKQKKTGQVFRVTNSSPLAHNVAWSGLAYGLVVPQGKVVEIEVEPARLPTFISCSIHRWMSAYAWAFDHPYAAVTDSEGNYEIKNVPLGVEVGLMAWHAERGWLAGGKNGEKIKLADRTTVRDFKVKVKAD
jgi:hypothetical protein